MTRCPARRHTWDDLGGRCNSDAVDHQVRTDLEHVTLQHRCTSSPRPLLPPAVRCIHARPGVKEQACNACVLLGTVSKAGSSNSQKWAIRNLALKACRQLSTLSSSATPLFTHTPVQAAAVPWDSAVASGRLAGWWKLRKVERKNQRRCAAKATDNLDEPDTLDQVRVIWRPGLSRTLEVRY